MLSPPQPHRFVIPSFVSNVAAAPQNIRTTHGIPTQHIELGITTNPVYYLIQHATTPRKGVSMFERFTDRARKVMAFANLEALRFHHDYIAPEHILLGLIKEGQGVAIQILKSLEFDPIAIARRTRSCITPGTSLEEQGNMPPAPQAKAVIEFAIAEARAVGNNYTGTEHLLLGLLHLASPPTIPNQIFEQLGLTLPAARHALISALGVGVKAGPTENPYPFPTIHQTLVYQAAVTLLSRHYIPPLQPDQIAQCVRDAEQILNHVITNTPRTP